MLICYATCTCLSLKHDLLICTQPQSSQPPPSPFLRTNNRDLGRLPELKSRTIQCQASTPPLYIAASFPEADRGRRHKFIKMLFLDFLIKVFIATCNVLAGITFTEMLQKYIQLNIKNGKLVEPYALKFFMLTNSQGRGSVGVGGTVTCEKRNGRKALMRLLMTDTCFGSWATHRTNPALP